MSARNRVAPRAYLSLRLCLLGAVIVLASHTGGQRAIAQDSPDLRAQKARLIGTLLYTDLTVDIEGVPVEQVVASLSRALDIAIVPRYAGDRINHGIDPELPVFLHMERASALTVLEAVLDQVAVREPCTWQLRTGFIEIGTKERLSTPAASEVRTYDIKSLLIEPAYFESSDSPVLGNLTGDLAKVMDGGAKRMFQNHAYKTAALAERLTERKTGQELALELAKAIVETIEPGNWDYGQFTNEPVEEDGAESERNEGGERDRRTRRGRMTRKIAIIRMHDGRLVITAPDYIHRQIDGYPKITRPAALDEDLATLRSAAATADNCAITVVGIRPETPAEGSP